MTKSPINNLTINSINNQAHALTRSLHAVVLYEGKAATQLRTGKVAKYYDWASLTKVIFTTTALMRARDQKLLNPQHSVVHYLPWSPHRSLTIAQLLNHTSGLKWWLSLQEQIGPWSKGLRERNWLILQSLLRREQLATRPAPVYSDLDFWYLGMVVESVYGQPLHQVWLGLRQDLKLGTAHFQLDNKTTYQKSQYAVTCGIQRQGLLRGTAQDDNTWVLGGVAPHAGLFGTMSDLLKWLKHMRQSYYGEGEISSRTMKEFTSAKTPDGAWGYGFMKPSGATPSAGPYVSAQAFGHLGFSGTSLWFDPKRDIGVAVLANRRLATPGDKDYAAFRFALHRTLEDALKSKNKRGKKNRKK